MSTDRRMRTISKEGKARVMFLHVDFRQKHILGEHGAGRQACDPGSEAVGTAGTNGLGVL